MLLAMRAGGRHSCWHAGDLAWRLFLQGLGHDLARTVRLWDDDESQLAAFAVLTPSRAGRPLAAFDIQVHPRLRGSGLEEEVLDWIESEFRQTIGAGQLIADPGVYDDDAAQIAALERRGYSRTEGESVLLLRPLRGSLPRPSPPDGFSLRALAGEHEAAARAAAHRDAFESTRITTEAYLSLMRAPGYDRALDEVAVAPDGTLAAFALCWLDEANRVGELEPVGTCGAFRRMGLAQAVVMDGLARMQALGAREAVVGPIDRREEAAVRLYDSVGFRVQQWLHWYEREVGKEP
jgi:ribosomal protein S18 acetylase RimI-like enzyme